MPRLRAAGVAEAFSLAGFAFYLQAMLMPLLPELSPGPPGAAAAAKAVDFTVLGTALWCGVLCCRLPAQLGALACCVQRRLRCRRTRFHPRAAAPPLRSTYLVTGFFGAATYGDQTSANLLENEWLPGVGTFVLNMARSGGGAQPGAGGRRGGPARLLTDAPASAALPTCRCACVGSCLRR